MSMQRRVRISQTITPFGVGAIYDILGESFVATDTVRWGTAGEPVTLDRLAAGLGVGGFRQAPEAPDRFGAGPVEKLPFHRFPEWTFCSRCRQMTRLNVTYAERTPKCRVCPGRPRLVPMRFITICESGHLGDVDWWWWAHSRGRGSCRERNEGLRFRTVKNAGGGLASLEVSAACGASRSLDRITGKDALKLAGIRCTGAQPWQRRGFSECTSIPQVVQRGSSNVHFPRIASALDIPPWSDYKKPNSVSDLVIAHADFGRMLGQFTAEGAPNRMASILAEVIAQDLETLGDEAPSAEEVLAIGVAEWNARNGGPIESAGDDDLELGEFRAFQAIRSEVDDRSGFITSHADIVSEDDGFSTSLRAELARLVDDVCLAHRLREVRALTGFTRLQPGGTDVGVVSPSLGRHVHWLPAIQVFGEGVFVQLSEPVLSTWERQPAVVERAARTDQARVKLGWDWLPESTPRFLALHTLAHLLIRRLTFECGYASASLREKVYARNPSDGEPMGGILIYTAAGDAEGSLGGLVRQGEPPRFARTLIAAAADAAWCSVDPICGESRSGPGALNAGACHACSLVAETSCTAGNLLLDRTLLIGDDEVPGLLTGLIRTAVTDSM